MSDTKVYFKAYCDWQIFGEFHGDMTLLEWVNDKLKIWQGLAGEDAQEDHFLHDFEVTETIEGGAWGLMYARFWVITRVNVQELNDVEDIIKARLDHMVYDTDVSIRFTQRLLEVPPLPKF